MVGQGWGHGRDGDLAGLQRHQPHYGCGNARKALLEIWRQSVNNATVETFDDRNA